MAPLYWSHTRYVTREGSPYSSIPSTSALGRLSLVNTYYVSTKAHLIGQYLLRQNWSSFHWSIPNTSQLNVLISTKITCFHEKQFIFSRITTNMEFFSWKTFRIHMRENLSHWTLKVNFTRTGSATPSTALGWPCVFFPSKEFQMIYRRCLLS